MIYSERIINGRKVIVDENGKICRTCNSLQDFNFAQNIQPPAQNPLPAVKVAIGSGGSKVPMETVAAYKADPPDVVELGRSSWTFLHTMAANYPEAPTDEQRRDMFKFISTFASVYPCTWCAQNLREYLVHHPPDVSNREGLGRWMCYVHNDVNIRLGKPSFDCTYWRARWVDGWDAFRKA